MFGRILTVLPARNRLGARRYVRIDDNVFSFCLDEQFSRDLPAQDVVEQIATESLRNGDKTSCGHIARRWWDIKEAGRFSGTIGTVMLDIEVRRVPKNNTCLFYSQPHDIRNRFDLLVALYERLQSEWTPASTENEQLGYFLPALAMRIGDDIITHFYDRSYGGQTWTGFGIADGQKTLIECLVMPVSKSAYLQLSFTQAPNCNIQGAYFVEHSEALIARIADTLHIDFAADNRLKTVVEQRWPTMSTQAVLVQHKDLLYPPQSMRPLVST